MCFIIETIFQRTRFIYFCFLNNLPVVNTAEGDKKNIYIVSLSNILTLSITGTCENVLQRNEPTAQYCTDVSSLVQA